MSIFFEIVVCIASYRPKIDQSHGENCRLGHIIKSDIQLPSIKVNKPFPSCLKPLFQSEAKCEAVDIEIYFHYYANKTHFQILHLALF